MKYLKHWVIKIHETNLHDNDRWHNYKRVKYHGSEKCLLYAIWKKKSTPRNNTVISILYYFDSCTSTYTSWPILMVNDAWKGYFSNVIPTNKSPDTEAFFPLFKPTSCKVKVSLCTWNKHAGQRQVTKIWEYNNMKARNVYFMQTEKKKLTPMTHASVQIHIIVAA